MCFYVFENVQFLVMFEFCFFDFRFLFHLQTAISRLLEPSSSIVAHNSIRSLPPGVGDEDVMNHGALKPDKIILPGKMLDEDTSVPGETAARPLSATGLLASVPLERPSSRSHFKTVHRESIDPNQDPIHLSLPAAAPSTLIAPVHPPDIDIDWPPASSNGDLDGDGDGDENVVEGDVMMSHLPLEPESYVGRHAEVQRLIQLINTHRYADCTCS
jgi:hypothetical protein